MSTFVRDPCGIVCVLLTYLAVFYADYVVIRWVVMQTMQNSLWGPFNVILFNTVVLLLMIAHVKAVSSDPGLVPLPQNKVDFSDIHSPSADHDIENWTVCSRCETYRPPRAHHCRICKRCIRRMDHHCPWINNCVGEQNQKYFIQFLIYVGALSLYSIILVVMSWMKDCPECPREPVVHQTRILHSVILSIESGLFGMFVSAVLTDQFQAIFGDETTVEQAANHGPYRPLRPKLLLLTEVCGRGHPLLWLLPCPTGRSKKYYDSPLLMHEV